jgi:hypothetical protein
MVMFRCIIVLLMILKSSVVGATECWFEEGNDVGCSITVQSVTLRIEPTGSVTAPGKAPQKLPLEKDFYIERVTMEPVGPLLLVVAEVTDSDYGAGLVALVDPVKLTLKWSAKFPAFNISPPLITAKAFYIGGIGTIAKYDSVSGRVVWIARGLYERETGAFNAFQRPRMEGCIVRFVENKTSFAKYRGVREIRVDDASGRIVSK